MKIVQSGCWQGGYPHGARSVRRGGEQDAALVVCGDGHDQHGEQDGDHRGAHEDPHQHGDQAAARHPGQVPHRAPRPRGREGQGSGEAEVVCGDGGDDCDRSWTPTGCWARRAGWAGGKTSTWPTTQRRGPPTSKTSRRRSRPELCQCPVLNVTFSAISRTCTVICIFNHKI